MLEMLNYELWMMDFNWWFRYRFFKLFIFGI